MDRAGAFDVLEGLVSQGGIDLQVTYPVHYHPHVVIVCHTPLLIPQLNTSPLAFFAGASEETQHALIAPSEQASPCERRWCGGGRRSETINIAGWHQCAE
jgi:hypothetical protein